MSISQVFLSANTVDFNYPEIRPSLDLNFARTKTLDPMISFVRNSGGSYVSANGNIKYAGVNEPRFGHDSSTGESLGLIIEEQRTNLLNWSQDFNNWFIDYNPQNGAPGDIQNSNELSPDGSSNFFTYTYGINSDLRYFFFGGQGKTYTASCFYKKSSTGNDSNIAEFQIHITGGTTVVSKVTYDFNTNTLSSVNTVSSGFEKYSNGVIRLWLTITDDGDGTGVFFLNTTNTLGSNLGKKILVWGAQVEEGTFPTSYIPTFGSTKTRSADVASITGVNFNNFYNQDKGTFLSRAKFIGPPILSTSNRTTLSVVGNRGFIWQMWEENINRARTVGVKTISRFNLNQAVSDLSLTGNIITSDSTQTLITTYSENDCTLAQNGEVVSKDISVKKFTDMDQLVIGDLNGGHYLNGVISQITYWPRNLPDSQLQSLSS